MGKTMTQPDGGIWGDDDVWKALMDLRESLDTLVPEHRVALGLHGTGSMARAKCKAIVAKARILEDMVKAVTAGRT